MDELDRSSAQALIDKIEELSSEWTGLRVIATGRPVELRGFNYSRWQCLEMLPLTASEQEELLCNEALAAGLDIERAIVDTMDRLRVLRERPELLSIADTPLTVRLLRPHLNENQANKSLGDLLYDVLLERLGEWGSPEGKGTTFQDFVHQFPDSLSRETLLARIALAIHNSSSKSITKEVLHMILSGEIPESATKNLVVSQGCSFFETNVLHQEQGCFVFPSQPLLQCALGCYIVRQLNRNLPLGLIDNPRQLWREYSFAACIARRKGLVGNLEAAFSHYLADLTAEGASVSPAAAMVVSEAKSQELAVQTIHILQNACFRPLQTFSDRIAQSTAAFAHTLRLAGQEGFDWFYEEYLNPKYPLDHVGFGIATDMLRYWLIQGEYLLNTYEVSKLRPIIEPHVTTRSRACHYLIPVLAIALPDQFSLDQRVLFYVHSLLWMTTRSKAVELLKLTYQSGGAQTVLRTLERSCLNSDDREAVTARLWLELCSDQPPLPVIQAVVAAASNEVNMSAIEDIERRIGKDRMEATLRWYVFQPSKLATAAAMILYRRGERNLHLLSPGLCQGLHDGGRIEGAEQMLHALIQEQGDYGIDWLVNHFPGDRHYGHGAHSASWRILLTELLRSNDTNVQALSETIQHLGEFTLARYPEIRRSFQNLLTQKPEYREQLTHLTGSFNNIERFCAASVLFTCFPAEEKEASVIVARGIESTFQFYEFFRFCLCLNVGPTTLNFLSERLEQFTSKSRIFILCLLHHNGDLLTDVLYRELVQGLIGEGSSLDIYWLQNPPQNAHPFHLKVRSHSTRNSAAIPVPSAHPFPA
jgi:hypothetical protein